jgi:putative FmdB family regulatory protein
MPLYEFGCRVCGYRTEELRRPEDLGVEICPSCGSAMQRLISAVSLGGRVDPGPGRAAWPRTWRGLDGGDPGAVSYWRRRIEREMKEEDRNPELRARADALARGGTHDHSHGAGDPAPEPYIGPGLQGPRPARAPSRETTG